MQPYLVVDACVAGAWSFSETYTPQAQIVLRAIEDRRVIAVAPDRFSEEMLRICQKKTQIPSGNGLSVTTQDAWARFLDVMASPLVFHPSGELHEDAWNLAIQVTGLTTHDALYIACAKLWGAELWTLDARLAAVPQTIFSEVYDLRSETFPY